jgi:dihydrofolate reductase
VDAIMVIGGAEIFAQTIDDADRLEITTVHARPQGDTLFPPIDVRRWHAVSQQEHPAGADDSAAYAVVTYRRREPENLDTAQG